MPSYIYAARYVYTDTVVQNDNFLRLSAYSDAYQTPVTTSIRTLPEGRPVEFKDSLGNSTHRVRLTTPHRELTILSIGNARLAKPPSSPLDVSMQSLGYDAMAEEFLAPSPLVDPESLAEAARDIVGESYSLMESVVGMVNWIYSNIEYQRGNTDVMTTAREALDTGKGVCQDMTHLAIGLLRSVGIPARYVSGLLGTQAGETHAWLEFLHPYLGWLPADPTRGQPIANGADLIKFAVGRDYTHASPIEGTFISKGSGWLDATIGQVFLEDERPVSFDDAMELIS